MTERTDVLERLKGRLKSLEERQRASGGTADPAFWDNPVATRPTDGPFSSSGARKRRPRRLAPASRPPARGRGPWARCSAEVLASVDPLSTQWLRESDMDDPGWLDAMSDRAEEIARAEAQGGTGALGEDEPTHVMVDAMIGRSLHPHEDGELRRAVEWVAHQRATQDVMLVNIVAELAGRDVAAPDGLSRTDWLRDNDPSLSAAAARAIVRVGEALNHPRWARLRTLVSTQQVTVPKAAQVVEFEQRTCRVADPQELSDALDDVLAQAPVLRPEELSILIREHTEQLKPPRDDDALDEGRRQSRGLWFTQPNASGMVKMRGILDPEAAAVIKSAVDPLSAPCPTTDEHGRTIERDHRNPAKRRADALVEIIRRGVSAPDGVPATDKAKVVVTIDWDTLLGRLRGTGWTQSGDVLSPETVRRMACDAEIIPMVLGGRGEPLDVGRRHRLVTKGLRLALIARDKGCTFPGCSKPPQWCDAHHTVYWSRGGRTSLLTTALLCEAHHTHVHRHDLTATVTATAVTWHL